VNVLVEIRGESRKGAREDGVLSEGIEAGNPRESCQGTKRDAPGEKRESVSWFRGEWIVTNLEDVGQESRMYQSSRCQCPVGSISLESRQKDRKWKRTSFDAFNLLGNHSP